MDIKIKGTLLGDEYAEIVRYFGFTGVTCPGDVEKALEEAAGEEVTLYINSDGGSLIAGTEIYSMLKRYKGKTTAHVESRSASAATVAMMACGKIVAEPVSLLCVHNPSAYTEGDEYVFTEAAEDLRNIKEAIISAYSPRMKMTREEMSELMNKNAWINAMQAKDYGLIDTIAEEDPKKPAIINAAPGVIFPTQKMISDYRAHIEAEKNADIENTAKRARALLDLYR